jgi:hypothetical protein
VIFDATNTHAVCRPESGAATARFLVLQHERRRRPALGPRASSPVRTLDFRNGPLRDDQFLCG